MNFCIAGCSSKRYRAARGKSVLQQSSLLNVANGEIDMMKFLRLKLKSATMKDPSRRSTSPSIINEDVIMNGHSHEDDNPFAEYMWMENEEEFNRQIEEELWEEEFIERCFQEMLEEEEEHEWFIPARDLPQTMDQIQDQFNDLVISDGSSLEDLVVKSNLNPNAKEFVPGVKY
ncbi:hypothetical protein JRQ81_005735 [Phrynocephalus forsythii]|uniref:Polyadenylate-binding protein-interacting protein 2 n=2 Tax=Agamidae TaxID=81953 RepID=A0A9Q1B6Z0_9SAUR|nr:hypothetical protein JRQ81_005735 [Phrynocephalus forsythii]